MTQREVVCGLEIHQQLDTGKLFCRCPGVLSDDFVGSFKRRLRPTYSEMGAVDQAALMEATKKRLFTYMVPESVCLVEADEEPPRPVDRDALDIALLFARMVDAVPVDEVHFMRKIVIDGSNTTGFQRTALIANGGSIVVDGKRIGIQTICLEEDAARPLERKDGFAVYNLDRLGVPLIEVATDPDIDSPVMARRTAEHIGMLLRATGKVRRGIGTIREDLNVSIPGGARIEAKGVQELRLISSYVEGEVARQKRLLAARDVLVERSARPGNDMQDVTDVLKGTGSKVIRRAIDSGGVAVALVLHGFQGLLGPFHDGEKCLGPELAGYARAAGVGGLFHTDELPAYGITDEEVEALCRHLGMEEGDAFVLVAGPKSKVVAAVEQARLRASMALEGVPEETRDPLPDGTTRYSRPLPGGARMYPETDVPPVVVDLKIFEELKMPEMPWDKQERIAMDYGVGGEQAQQLVSLGIEGAFEAAALEHENVPRGFLASSFVSNTDLPESVVLETMSLVGKGDIAKEAAQNILDILKENPEFTVKDAVESLGLAGVDEDEVRRGIEALVNEREDFVKKRGKESIGPLMGVVMKEYRGKIDGKRLNQLLKEAVDKIL